MEATYVTVRLTSTEPLVVGEKLVEVAPINSTIAARMVLEHHYLHRKPTISFAFGLIDGFAIRNNSQPGFFGEQDYDGRLVGVVTFGVPASRHLQQSVCPSNPDVVLELNRLWVADEMPRNTESWFVSRALRQLPPRIVVSYADTAYGYQGYVYRALNFRYAGWTDMERKTPRFDYIVPGKHTRDAFRGVDGAPQYTAKIRRKPKIKYWIPTGNRRERAALEKLCGWAHLDWKTLVPPKT